MSIPGSNLFQLLKSGSLWLTFISLFSVSLTRAQEKPVPYADLTHESKVFGHPKYYRLYLPKGYESGTERYPVIYFFHGWGGRHFMDDNALLEYGMIGNLVDKYRVILVMWDGNIEESERRPYNIGNHKDVKYNIQMKDYFPELVTHIDSSYRTLTDRNHRGIIGFSMGGIMSFFLAGKYPDKVCAAVNLAGTPEFFIGYPENHTLYPVRYTFKNLMDVNTRQQGGDSDILVYLNEEVQKGAAWEGNPYEFYGFRGGHMVDPPGETKAFEMAMKFVAGTFEKGMPVPATWSHYDLYDTFEVWDYKVTSNKKVPGFICLSNVSRSGLGFTTRKWLPDGPVIKGIHATVVTAAIYRPETWYNLIINDESTGEIWDSTVQSDKDGRITLQCNESGVQTGIYNTDEVTLDIDGVTGSHPVNSISVLNYKINEHDRLLTIGDQNLLHIRLFNRGGSNKRAYTMKVTLHSGDSAIVIPNKSSEVKVPAGSVVVTLPPFHISCHKAPPPHGEPFQVKFTLSVETGDTVFHDEVVVPVLFEAPLFSDIQMDDGRNFRERSYGKGNGNGQADAGEQILVYAGKNRLRLYTNDPYVLFEDEEVVDEQIPAIWEDGYTLSSLITLSKDCPDGHIIEFTGSFETNTWNPIERNLHWGRLKITVHNK